MDRGTQNLRYAATGIGRLNLVVKDVTSTFVRRELQVEFDLGEVKLSRILSVAVFGDFVETDYFVGFHGLVATLDWCSLLW